MSFLSTVDLIVIHHSATKDSDTLSWGAIRRYHTNVLGWTDIGYHAGIEYIRDSYEVLIGRPPTQTGAHTSGENYHSLGFCFVGNFDDEEPNDELLRTAARRWLVPALKRHSLNTDALRPHSDFANKTCPGSQFSMDRLREVCREVWGDQ